MAILHNSYSRRQILRAGGTLFAGALLVPVLPKCPELPPSLSGPAPDPTPKGLASVLNWVAVTPADRLGLTSALSVHRPETDFEAARQSGFELVRWDLTWERVEYPEGIFNFGYYDAAVDAASNLGLRFSFILDYGHRDYDGTYQVISQPGRAGFRSFAKAMVSRYGHVADTWEIWNEPNDSHFWTGGGDATAYAQLVREVAPVIKQVQPNSMVMAGALATIDTDFLQQILAQDIGGHVDTISVHPYRASLPESVIADVGVLHEVAGSGLNIAISEWGYSAYEGSQAGVHRPVSYEEQASLIVRTLVLGHVLGLPLTVWYDATDDGADRSNVHDNFGLFNSELAPKPAQNYCKQLLEMLGQHRADAYVRIDDLFITHFVADSDAADRYLVWSEAEVDRTLPVPGYAGSQVVRFSDFGSTILDAEPVLNVGPNDVLIIEGQLGL